MAQEEKYYIKLYPETFNKCVEKRVPWNQFIIDIEKSIVDGKTIVINQTTGKIEVYENYVASNVINPTDVIFGTKGDTKTKWTYELIRNTLRNYFQSIWDFENIHYYAGIQDRPVVGDINKLYIDTTTEELFIYYDAVWHTFGCVQSDWNTTDSEAQSFIKNKPTKLSQFENDTNFITIGEVPPLPDDIVIDANYVHTDNNYTEGDKQKVDDLSGTNTGDQDLSGLVPYAGATQDIDVNNKKITSLADPVNDYDATNKIYVDTAIKTIEPPAGGYANNLYFDETPSDILPYETLTYTPSMVSTVENFTVNAGEGIKTFHQYLYPTGVSVDLIPSGLWSFQFYGKVSTAVGVTKLGVTYFRRELNGTEHDLFTVWSNEIDNLTDTWIKFDSSTQPNFSVNLTDRMGARILAQTTHVNDVTINYTVGDGFGAYLNNPNRIRHSQLRSLNGESEYQHIDSTIEKTTPIDADKIGLWDSVVSKFVTTSWANIKTALSSIFIAKTQNELTREPTGFSRNDALIITANGDRTVTLTGQVFAYYQGTRISEIVTGWISPQHGTDTAKLYYLSSDGYNISWSQNTFYLYQLQICIAKYDNTNSRWYYFRECHGFMPWQDHFEFHNNIGTYKSSGGLIPTNSYVLKSTVASERRIDVNQALIYDEDLPTVIPALTSKSYTQFALTGAGIDNIGLAKTDYINLSTNNPYYNQFTTSWVNTLVPANSVFTVWDYVLPVTADPISREYRHLFVQPQWITQAQNSSALAIATAVTAEKNRLPSELNLNGLLSTEIVAINRITLSFHSGNWRIESVDVLSGNKYSQIGSPSGNYLTSGHYPWISSLHTGTANKIAGFGASGEAVVGGGEIVPLLDNGTKNLQGKGVDNVQKLYNAVDQLVAGSNGIPNPVIYTRAGDNKIITRIETISGGTIETRNKWHSGGTLQDGKLDFAEFKNSVTNDWVRYSNIFVNGYLMESTVTIITAWTI